MIASRSIRIEPRTACSESRFWGGSRSITGGGLTGGNDIARLPDGAARHIANPGPRAASHQQNAGDGGPNVDNYVDEPLVSAGGPAPADGPVPAGSVQAADDPDQLALDPDVVVEHRRVIRVGRLQADPSRFLEEALERDRVL